MTQDTLGVESFPSERGVSLVLLMSEAIVVGLAEVAEMLEVNKHTAKKYVGRDDFPEPLARLASGPVWRRSAVERWAARTLPLPLGRPPRTGKRK